MRSFCLRVSLSSAIFSLGRLIDSRAGLRRGCRLFSVAPCALRRLSGPRISRKHTRRNNHRQTVLFDTSRLKDPTLRQHRIWPPIVSTRKSHVWDDVTQTHRFRVNHKNHRTHTPLSTTRHAAQGHVTHTTRTHPPFLSNFGCVLDDPRFIADRFWRRVFRVSDLSVFDGRVMLRL